MEALQFSAKSESDECGLSITESEKTIMVETNYPEAVIEVLDDDIQYPSTVMQAVESFAAAQPWHGSIISRKKKFLQLNRDLARACNIDEPNLGFGPLDGSSSGSSYYSASNHRIVLIGKLSVVTFLHEFAHALGFDEREACRWSINLFRKCFPRQYSRLIHVGHTLLRPETVARMVNGRNHGKATESKEMC